MFIFLSYFDLSIVSSPLTPDRVAEMERYYTITHGDRPAILKQESVENNVKCAFYEEYLNEGTMEPIDFTVALDEAVRDPGEDWDAETGPVDSNESETRRFYEDYLNRCVSVV